MHKEITSKDVRPSAHGVALTGGALGAPNADSPLFPHALLHTDFRAHGLRRGGGGTVPPPRARGSRGSGRGVRETAVQNSAHAHCPAGREGMPREGEREGERQCPPSTRREGERKGHPCTLRTRRVFMRMLYTLAIAVAFGRLLLKPFLPAVTHPAKPCRASARPAARGPFKFPSYPGMQTRRGRIRMIRDRHSRSSSTASSRSSSLACRVRMHIVRGGGTAQLRRKAARTRTTAISLRCASSSPSSPSSRSPAQPPPASLAKTARSPRPARSVSSFAAFRLFAPPCFSVLPRRPPPEAQSG